ncbi:MAG: Holliday junction resolvase RuvX [Bacteroidales bacterium]|nr:Holliday junction resolvase RuvX [Bacteroidales bacterium]MEE0520019.1 Holliday junction resolvase RuvX [Bacteroidaceae bacterium]
MARILAIDYGQKRTGLAVSDTMQLIAGALGTVDTKDLEKYILNYVSKEDVSTIVIGKPTQLNGEDSENMKRVEPFYFRLKKLFPDKEITYYDERFTSVLAHQAMLQSGIGKKARQNKALVDKISATIILEDYMQSRLLQR